jgi:hypothetical protein
MVSGSQPLEVATFEVAEVSTGQMTSYEDGSLVVDLDALREAAAAEPAIARVEVDIVRPGESVRIANVLDAVEPSVRADDPATTFPGALGRLAHAGSGRSNRLRQVAVIPVCDLSYTVYATRRVSRTLSWTWTDRRRSQRVGIRPTSC